MQCSAANRGANYGWTWDHLPGLSHSLRTSLLGTPPTRQNLSSQTFQKCRASWKSYQHRFRRIVFAFVDDVPGLPAGNLQFRRYVPLPSRGDVVWEKYCRCIDFDDAVLGDKVGVAELIMIQWCRAIFDGNEDMFIAEHNLPHWKPYPSPHEASVQAAAVAIDPATEQPTVGSNDDAPGGTAGAPGSSDAEDSDFF